MEVLLAACVDENDDSPLVVNDDALPPESEVVVSKGLVPVEVCVVCIDVKIVDAVEDGKNEVPTLFVAFTVKVDVMFLDVVVRVVSPVEEEVVDVAVEDCSVVETTTSLIEDVSVVVNVVSPLPEATGVVPVID